jgi:hypothetical protein
VLGKRKKSLRNERLWGDGTENRNDHYEKQSAPIFSEDNKGKQSIKQYE